MDKDFSYDPVTAVDESSATGETAEIFADIRATMNIPLVTSIWRGLASMDDSLARTWALTKPLYTDGLAERALGEVIERATLPLPAALAPTQLACLDIDASQLTQIRTIINAYNRSNGLNLVTLSALLTPARDDESITATGPGKPQWTEFPKLLEKTEIPADTWDLVRHVNAFGAHGIDANIATLWRHLAHWPGLLALIYTAFAPGQADGSIDTATAEVTALAETVGSALARAHPADVSGIPEIAQKTITGYVKTPTQVVRMVTLGHTMAQWLTPVPSR